MQYNVNMSIPGRLDMTPPSHRRRVDHPCAFRGMVQPGAGGQPCPCPLGPAPAHSTQRHRLGSKPTCPALCRAVTLQFVNLPRRSPCAPSPRTPADRSCSARLRPLLRRALPSSAPPPLPPIPKPNGTWTPLPQQLTPTPAYAAALARLPLLRALTARRPRLHTALPTSLCIVTCACNSQLRSHLPTRSPLLLRAIMSSRAVREKAAGTGRAGEKGGRAGAQG